jgi:hypothetical protein
VTSVNGNDSNSRIPIPDFTYDVQDLPNKALQLTANPLLGLSAAELSPRTHDRIRCGSRR